MVNFAELRKIINSSRMGIKKYGNGRTILTDSADFKGMPLSALEEAQALVEQGVKEDMYALARKCGIKQVDTLISVTERAKEFVGNIMPLINDKRLSAREIREKATTATAIRDSIVNPRWNINSYSDPTHSTLAYPNIYISPWEANSLYSQKGIFETVINKKAKSILLNGINFRNTHLSQKQIDLVKEKMEVRNIKQLISDSTLNSLCYGGNLTFPLFKKDTPLTMSLGLDSLLKLGVLGKDCIDYFVALDRWQTFIIPPYNPTQKDFIRPEVYTIPFLGADVHHGRCARIVTAKQAGYWGQIANMGWGISDFCGYLQSGLNYKTAVQSLPLMIQQMSILARVINVDGVLATEGSNALDALTENNTIRTREASTDNPVTMDVLGDLKSIDRNFGEVPELIRLLRQDFASDSTIPEPMLFSSEKGNFASGDDTEGNQSKQWESVKMIHKEIEPQLKQLVKILIIDTLGTDDNVIKSLPYTQLTFDEPVIANALERAQIGKYHSENIFNLVSARIPIDIAVEMASEHVSSDMAVSSGLIDKLKEIQKISDERDKKRFELEVKETETNIDKTESDMELAEESIKMQGNTVSNPSSSSSTGKVKKPSSDKVTKGRSPAEEAQGKAEAAKTSRQEGGYSKLEQKMHEKTRGSSKRAEKEQRAKNKQV